MKRNWFPFLLLLVIAGALLNVANVSALAGYNLDWWTVDGGGAISSTGGNYSLGGSIGQPDAGTSAGGNYTLIGGFWGGGADEIPPTVVSSLLANSNPINLDSVDFTVTFSEPVSGVDATDFTLNTTGVTGASITGVSGSGATYTVTVNTGSGNGTIRLDVLDDDTILDTAGNPLNGGFTSGEVYTIDKTAPDTQINTHPANPSNSANASFTFSSPDGTATFECSLEGGAYAACTSPKNYTGLADGSHTFAVRAKDPAGNLDATPASYTWMIDTTAPDTQINTHPANPSNSANASFTFSSPDGTATFECSLEGGAYAACTSPKNYTGLADGSHTFAVRAKDLVGNLDATPASYTWTIDTTAPTVTSSVRANPNPTNAASVGFTVTFSEPVSGVDATDFTLNTTGVTGASVTGVSGSGATYTVTVNTGSGDGTIRLDVPASATVTDLFGNPLAGLPYTSGDNYVVDKTAPTVVSSVRAGPNPTSAASVKFTVTFSESVIGVDVDDFSLTTTGVSGATVSGVSGSGNVYTVTVNAGSGSGTIRLDVVDNNTIVDLALNPLGGAGPDNGSYTSGETYDVLLHHTYFPLVIKQ